MDCSFTSIELQFLKYHKLIGADYSKFMSRYFHISLKDAFMIHKKLVDEGYLERVEGRIVNYHKKVLKRKKFKHRNHTYYILSIKGEHFLKKCESKFGEVFIGQ